MFFCTIFCRKGISKCQCFTDYSIISTISSELCIRCLDVPPHRSRSPEFALVVLCTGLAALLLGTSCSEWEEKEQKELVPRWCSHGFWGQSTTFLLSSLLSVAGWQSSASAERKPEKSWARLAACSWPRACWRGGQTLQNVPHTWLKHQFTSWIITTAPFQT